MKLITSLAFSASLLLAGTAHANTVYWTDWTSNTANTAIGVINSDVGLIDVTTSHTSNYNFVQTSGGTNYWSPATPYISADISNAPGTSDIIALSSGGTETIVFSSAVVDPLIALVSWNGNKLEFGVPIEIVSVGGGYWGNGSAVLNGAGTGLTGSGELHGVVRLKGTYTTISFTHTSENWHGYTVGITTAVPEPENFALLLAGLPLLMAARRRNK